uniref:Putative secreted protein n=1 Tax=Ixodes ricinus TaxID=34613 RepID=A0A6B0UZJ9_IXORI
MSGVWCSLLHFLTLFSQLGAQGALLAFQALNLHLELLERQPGRGHILAQRRCLVLEDALALLQLAALGLESAQLLNEGVQVVRADALVQQGLAHLAPGHAASPAAHGARDVDELPLEGDHTVARPALQPDAGGLLQVFGHQGVSQGKVEGRQDAWLLHRYQVKQPRHVLGRGYLFCSV